MTPTAGTNHPDDYPTVISFAAGAEYYHENARRLQAQIEDLGMHSSIDFYEDLGGLDWAQLCRFKVQFYRRKMEELDRPLLWLDADTKILGRPEKLRRSEADFGAMLRNSYLADYDPYKSARMWSPSLLYFNNSEISKRFMDHICAVDAQSPENITDDFVLHEAWSSFNEHMAVLVLPRKYHAVNENHITDETWFLHGDSGNVDDFKEKVLQHDTIKNKGAILTMVAADAMKQQDYALAETLLNTASNYGYDTAERTRRLAETVRRQKRPSEAAVIIRGFHERNPQDLDGKILFGKQLMREMKLTSAERLFKEVEQVGHPKFSGLATSLIFDLRQERKAKVMRVDPADRPRVWWMKEPYPGNLGDILNPYIIEKLTGIPPKLAPKGKGMLAIGSVIKFAQAGCDVWGTGTPRMTDKLNPLARFRAVRGPLTRELVLASGGECPEVYGDAALLMPRLYNPRVKKKYRLGVIRHVRQRSLGILGPEVKDLNLLRVGFEEIEKFIDELLECEMIVSTSLHGIILANAYGIPARWAEFTGTSRTIQGDGTKYIDYFRSVDLPIQTPLDLADFDVLGEGLTRFIDPGCDIQFDGDSLLQAFPGILADEFTAEKNLLNI